VTSMACGPAREIFDAYRTMENPDRLKSTLIDFDLQALAYVSEMRDRKRLQRHITLVNENLLYLALGRTKTPICNQDLVYTIGLIDYFDDALVVKLLNLAHRLLRVGGRAIVGNFHTSNRYRAMMDHVLDWRLIHRCEEDMNRLFSRSAFKRACTGIRFEEEKINMFAECVKSTA
jgi:extracellular factor (EF) 3-hydroxypalmitic acid methyl ester biosynthesis protein